MPSKTGGTAKAGLPVPAESPEGRAQPALQLASGPAAATVPVDLDSASMADRSAATRSATKEILAKALSDPDAMEPEDSPALPGVVEAAPQANVGVSVEQALDLCATGMAVDGDPRVCPAPPGPSTGPPKAKPPKPKPQLLWNCVVDMRA